MDPYRTSKTEAQLLHDSLKETRLVKSKELADDIITEVRRRAVMGDDYATIKFKSDPSKAVLIGACKHILDRGFFIAYAHTKCSIYNEGQAAILVYITEIKQQFKLPSNLHAWEYSVQPQFVRPSEVGLIDGKKPVKQKTPWWKFWQNK